MFNCLASTHAGQRQYMNCPPGLYIRRQQPEAARSLLQHRQYLSLIAATLFHFTNPFLIKITNDLK
jgi:hypothetical protein